MVLSPAPATKRVGSEPASRTLAYQEKIARSAEEAKPAVTQEQAATPKASIPAAPAPVQGTEATAAPAAGENDPAPEQSSTEMAALPPDDGEASDPNALPWQRQSPSNEPQGIEAEGADPMPPPPGAYDDPEAALGEDVDPNAWPGGPEEEPQEWVQVLVSGAGMHGTAAEDAPMLFAFPYGRVLRVVSRYEGWVEVTDPQSAATGWMQAHLLAPAPPPGTPYDAEAMYDEEPRGRGGWLRRNSDIFGDMINRALGGH